MHCCLITAPTITEFRSRGELLSAAVQSAACEPQLGILSVAAVLELCGDRPHIVDVNSSYMQYTSQPGALQDDAFADYLAEIAIRSNADLYGLSSICSTYPLSIRVARSIKQKRPYAMILFGGPQASVVDVPTLDAFPFIDFVLRGEVERTLPYLIDELQGDYCFVRVGGLTYRDGAAVKRNANAEVIEDLDDLPDPAYHLSNYLRGSKSASIELGRGCPFACTFCSTNDFFRRRFRLRSPRRVLAHMREIARVYSIKHFELVHDMFTVDRKRVVAFCEEMLASDEGFTWDCSARTDCVDEELLELMARSGCRGVFFGIETGSKKMQRVIDKDLDPVSAMQALDIAQSLGMKTTSSLITGFPEEDWDDVRETLRVFMHSARCSLSRPQLNLLAPLAGTPIYTAHKHEMVLEDIYSDMSHQGLSQSDEDLELIRRHPEIFPNFYLIPVKSTDRNVLFELREFLSMSIERFRWLICAIDNAMDLLKFHNEWRAWRVARRGDLLGSEMRRYYAGGDFPGDFLEFVEILNIHRLEEDPAVYALACAERTMEVAREIWGRGQFGSAVSTADARLRLNDVPRCGGSTQMMELCYRIEDVVKAVVARTVPIFQGRVSYATRLGEDGDIKMVEISNWLADVIRACDGERTVAEILDELKAKLPDVDEDSSEFFLLGLLEGAHARGFIEVCETETLRLRARSISVGERH